MGEEASEPVVTAAVRRRRVAPATVKKAAPWTPIRNVPRDDDGELISAEAKIAARYDLPLDDDLYRLFGVIRSLATRDLNPHVNTATSKKQIEKASVDLEAVLKHARDVEESIRRLRGAVTRFEQHEYQPVVMQYLFGAYIDPPLDPVETEDGPRYPGLFPPEELRPIWDLFQDEKSWKVIEARLKAIWDLPAMKGAPKTVPHVTLKKAVGEIRTYWKRRGRSWEMGMLVTAKAKDDVTILERTEERFVADCLGSVDFPFSLPDLRRAWRKR